jgi:hypothetical protein
MSLTNPYLSNSNQATENIDGNNQPGVINLKDYTHASRLFVADNQIRAPKLGFLYYVKFIINREAQVFDVDPNVGVFVKKIDLPKFQIKTEVLNQYNRKKQVQTGISYNPITLDFHDDAIGITNSLWVNYYKNIIADGNYDTETTNSPRQFGDTKYGINDYEYGIYNRGIEKSFFDRIDIYLLNPGKDHTLVSLINPKITDWRHDSLNSSEGAKALQNSMTLVYENVLYYKGSSNKKIEGFVNQFYDTSPSPFDLNNPRTADITETSIDSRPENAVIFDRAQAPIQSGNPLFDKQGKARSYSIPGKQITNLFDRPGKPRQYGVINAPNTLNNPLLDFAAILAKDYVNQNGFGRVGPKGYNIASSALNNTIRNPAGKYYDPPSTQAVPGLFQLSNGLGINVFKAFNRGVDGKLRVNPAAIVFPPKR